MSATITPLGMGSADKEYKRKMQTSKGKVFSRLKSRDDMVIKSSKLFNVTAKIKEEKY